ncbi:SPOR domain-containing protein (plasmid) [Pseudoalteromonas xiamenensis]|uniref:SPOR domain-containing protein n=1 Tax=Pseudoalteromonas xiamenensis TaxID=882626 RepID=UPI0027E4316F|nr:SPOR domain-containing protein [Pseudoalteromonas xiamenensis]WMN61918.1 SPOR domain-containing protein [Pseudoalteromonas xiamenensis]
MMENYNVLKQKSQLSILVVSLLVISGCGTTPQVPTSQTVSRAEFDELKQSHQQLEARIEDLLAVEQELKSVVLALDSMLPEAQQTVGEGEMKKDNSGLSATSSTLTTNPTEPPQVIPMSPVETVLEESKTSPHALQLALYYSQAHAEQFMQKLQQIKSTYLTAQRMRVIESSRNGTQEFRVIVQGFADKQGAVDACSTLMDNKISCFYKRLN